MFVVLFWNPKNYGPEGTITVVSVAEPELCLSPQCVYPDDKELKWLTKYNNPVYLAICNPVDNLKILLDNQSSKIKPHYTKRYQYIKNLKFDDEITF